MVLSKDSKKAYVLNQGDKTISILPLVGANNDSPYDVDQIKKFTQTISLKDYLGEKSVDLMPTSLAYRDIDKGDYLLVGSEGINGAIVINLNSIPVSRVGLEPAPTNDGDDPVGAGSKPAQPMNEPADEPIQARHIAQRSIENPNHIDEEDVVEEELPLEDEAPIQNPDEEEGLGW